MLKYFKNEMEKLNRHSNCSGVKISVESTMFDTTLCLRIYCVNSGNEFKESVRIEFSENLDYVARDGLDRLLIAALEFLDAGGK